MSLLDMRTVIICYAISNLICMIVAANLWEQNRKRLAGIGLWLIDFVFQFVALILVILRGVAPDFLTMTVSNSLIIGGTILLYIGLERFVGKRSRQVHNYVLLAGFVLVHAYFVYILPNLAVRNILISLGLLAICSQAVWLLLRRAAANMRAVTRSVGYVLIGFCLVSVARIIVELAVPSGNDFFHSNAYETMLLVTYQMLFIALTFSLFLMVNRRLFVELKSDIAAREQVEVALRQSEEKFFKAFQSSPDAILISRLHDGQILDVNDGFCRLAGYTWEEALSNTSIALGFWANPCDRDRVIADLRQKQKIYNQEFDFRIKSGEILNCLYSAEIIYLSDEAHILSVVRDVTDRKKAEEALRQSEERYQTFISQSFEAIYRTEFDHPIDISLPVETQVDLIYENAYMAECNQALVDMYNLPSVEAMIGMRLLDAHGGSGNPINRAAFRRLIEGGYKTTNDETLENDAFDNPVWFLSNTIGIVEKGYLVRLWGISIDITERKRVEEIVHLRLRLWEYAASHSIGDLMQKALDEIGALTNSPIGFYHFVEEDQNTLTLQAWSTRTMAEYCKAEGKDRHYPIQEAGVWVDCVYQRKPVIHNDYASLPNRKGLPEGHAELTRELVVPTLRDGRIVSILGVGNKPTEYSEQDVELVMYIADIIWTIVEQKRANEQIRQLNSRLEQLAMTDELTSVANRRSFFMRGDKEVKRSRRYKTPLSLLMLDIDEFKLFNDQYGHDIGDRVLQFVASTLQSSIREIDLLGRLGGEEFGILLPNTGAVEAGKLAERLRLAIEKETCSTRNQNLGVTVSIGVATCSLDILNLDEMLRNADNAMYRAKNQGRNRVVSLE